MHSALIVQKYGGATLSDPEKIKQVAGRIAKLSSQGKRMIVVVSAMGKSTNQLLSLASQVAKNPSRRELDMLLSTGERVSMSLLSLALNDLGCHAISFTGSQAGILTSDSHLNALISDVRAPRVEQALAENKIVVIAGFQGVSPVTREITTLGRGGSDITAIAMAAAFKAERCEILKDVSGVYSADPKLINESRSLRRLNYQQLMEMTFWGAKVLNYRSVELAMRNSVPLYVGPAADSVTFSEGTLISNHQENTMLESNQLLAVNSHELVLGLESEHDNLSSALTNFESFLSQNEIANPQMLCAEQRSEKIRLFITGSAETLHAIEKSACLPSSQFKLSAHPLSSLTATCTGSFSSEMPKKILQILQDQKIKVHHLLMNPMSVIVFIEQQHRDSALLALHRLIDSKSSL
jgi:aspartate kinase